MYSANFEFRQRFQVVEEEVVVVIVIVVVVLNVSKILECGFSCITSFQKFAEFGSPGQELRRAKKLFSCPEWFFSFQVKSLLFFCVMTPTKKIFSCSLFLSFVPLSVPIGFGRMFVLEYLSRHLIAVSVN